MPWDIPTTTVGDGSAIIRAGIASVIKGRDGRDVVSRGSQLLISEDQFQHFLTDGNFVKRLPKRRNSKDHG